MIPKFTSFFRDSQIGHNLDIIVDKLLKILINYLLKIKI